MIEEYRHGMFIEKFKVIKTIKDVPEGKYCFRELGVKNTSHIDWTMGPIDKPKRENRTRYCEVFLTKKNLRKIKFVSAKWYSYEEIYRRMYQ